MTTKKSSLTNQEQTATAFVKTESTPTLKPLPTAAASQNLPQRIDPLYLGEDATHDMREQNNRTGKIVGELVQKAQVTPKLRKMTLNYFLQCAEDDKLTHSTRALCWWKLTNKIIDWKVFVPLAKAKVPMTIQHLALGLNLDHREF